MQGLLGKHIVIYLQNANETLLQHRMKNILRNNISSQVAWRPFHIQSFRYQGCTVRKVLNTFYTLFIFLLLIFGYTSSIIACQARLDVKHKVLALKCGSCAGENSSSSLSSFCLLYTSPSPRDA